MIFYYYCAALVGVMLGSSAHVCLKTAALRTGTSPLGIVSNTFFLAGAAQFILSSALGIVSLIGLDFSVFYSITALNYVFIMSLAKVYLGEKLDTKKVLGSAIIVAGILVYNL